MGNFVDPAIDHMSESVIHRSISDDGVIEITQSQNIRSLYFGNDAKQSSIDINLPQELVLSYTRAMMSCLLFKTEPQRILLIGLGGGAIANFLLHHYPECSIDAVEIRQDVVKLAHGYFCLPEQENLQMFVTDARQFFTHQQGRFDQYDLILVDAFNHDGVSESVQSGEFFESCAARLSDKGILSINLWDNQCTKAIATIEHTFDHNILSLPVIDKGNVIILATRQKKTFELGVGKSKAKDLEQTLGLEFMDMIRQLKRANRWRALGRLFV